MAVWAYYVFYTRGLNVSMMAYIPTGNNEQYITLGFTCIPMWNRSWDIREYYAMCT